jgi:hypothetical protein
MLCVHSGILRSCKQQNKHSLIQSNQQCSGKLLKGRWVVGHIMGCLGSFSVFPGALTLCCVVMQVPMYSASGLRVQYLKVWEKSGYKVDKWVRKVCKSGDYSIRI